MTTSPEGALVAAACAAAAGDAGVRAVLGDPARIYDDRPEHAAFPYATIARVVSRASERNAPRTLETTITLHVSSRWGARTEALDVVNALRDALHGAALDVEGRRLVLLYASYADVVRAEDRVTALGVLDLHAVTEPAGETP
ncbi:MAG: hypothetical protein FD160_2822 [Caulobacteraceae bacterium]|nr:MAG: hypothetical protein FD160_2822 [Caulobacteraceae bacterium]